MNTSEESRLTDPVVAAFAQWSRDLRWDALTEKTRKAVKYELLDYLGCLIAGRALMGLPAWVAELADRGGRADAAMVGGPKVPAPIAALANGYYGHVLEYDDTHDGAVLHAGAAAIPAALAAAEYRRIHDPKAFLEAVLLGIEVTCRLGVATRLNLVDGGWIYTPLLGHFGAAAAAARLLSADAKTFATPSASPTASPAATINRAAKARAPSTCSRDSPRTTASTRR